VHTTTTQMILAPNITDRLTEGATGGLIGGGGGILVNEIASKIRGPPKPPAVTPPDEMDQMATELDQEAEDVLGRDDEDSASQELPPRDETPEGPVKRQGGLRGRETGKRTDTELPPGIPKVEPQLPEDPKEGVMIATDLPADPNVAARFVWQGVTDEMKRISDGFHEAPGKISKWLDSLNDTEEAPEPEPPKVEEEQNKEPEIGPEPRKVLNGIKDSFHLLPKPMTEAEKAAAAQANEGVGDRVLENRLSEIKKIPDSTKDPEGFKRWAEDAARTGGRPVTHDNVRQVMQNAIDSEKSFSKADTLDTIGSAAKGVKEGLDVAFKDKGGLGEAAKYTAGGTVREQVLSAFGSPQQHPLVQAVAKPHEDIAKTYEILKKELADRGQDVDPNNPDHQDRFLKILQDIKIRKHDYTAVNTR